MPKNMYFTQSDYNFFLRTDFILFFQVDRINISFYMRFKSRYPNALNLINLEIHHGGLPDSNECVRAILKPAVNQF